jgi:hypothetical protein
MIEGYSTWEQAIYWANAYSHKYLRRYKVYKIGNTWFIEMVAIRCI